MEIFLFRMKSFLYIYVMYELNYNRVDKNILEWMQILAYRNKSNVLNTVIHHLRIQNNFLNWSLKLCNLYLLKLLSLLLFTS
jgi:hypothetical protein